ncbi:MAG: hypothetical protein WD601_00445 [Pseudohongiellaceae bacterium]
MQTFIFILLLLLVLVFIIRLLRKHEAREMKESLDRSTPLQPLTLDFNSGSDAAAQDNGDLQAGLWPEQARVLREEKQFEQALMLCKQHHPRIQAYQQSLITLRTWIREILKQQQDPAFQLQALYRHAALADLFASRSRYKSELKNADLDALAAAAAKELELPYQQIGYQQLKLLTKTDIALLRDAWDEPLVHQHSEDYLGERWLELIARFAP